MQSKWMVSCFGLCCAVALVAGLSGGCGKASESITEKALEAGASRDGEEVDIDLDSDSGAMRIATKEGEMVISGDDETFSMTTPEGEMSINAGDAAAIPVNFPKDVPLPEGFKPQMVQTMEQGKSFMVTGPVEGSVKDAADSLRKEAAKQGWTEEQNSSVAGVMEQVACTKSGRMLSIMVMGEGGKTMVTITTSSE